MVVFFKEIVPKDHLLRIMIWRLTFNTESAQWELSQFFSFIRLEAIRSVQIINASSNAEVMFVCEHASNFIPKTLNCLGLPDELLKKHIAWDIGAEKIARHLSEIFDAKLILGKISRLVYDCNRPPTASDAIPQESEIYKIPGNEKLDAHEVEERIRFVYEPFHQVLSEESQKINRPILITIHSFTPIYCGVKRSVEWGILHGEDSRLADSILEFAPEAPLSIKRNEPYGPDDGVIHTIKKHGIDRKLLHAMIEFRNDLIQTPQQQKETAFNFASLLQKALLKLNRPIPSKI